ncbi:MAG: DegT/DnrJ/EryC1/StrS family aminotransferase [bacterium]|nr:DegT/DnrJ/EryC1/StrS family aminotransferase [bacterium]
MFKLAINGVEKTVKSHPGDILTWPIVNKAMDEAILEVLRAGNMSGTDITRRFEREYADWHGMTYGLGCNNGTAALHCAMYGIGIGQGDEIICPSITYWASCMPVLSLGGKIVFADIDPETLCIDPDDMERRITPRTKAVVVVHYCGRPADMDRIMPIARKHNLKVIEDVSHAHGAIYKGKMVGTFGDVAGFSLMSSKSFAIGEGGIMLTNDKETYDRAVILGHYERHTEITTEYLKAGAGLPWGGYKYRMHQMSSAVGLEQLKKYPAEIAEIDKAMNYFWDLLEGVSGVRPHRPAQGSDISMGGWYHPLAHYRPEELGGLSVTRFCEALEAEGVPSRPGCNEALHRHPLFSTIDVYNQGKPINAMETSFGRQEDMSLPVAEGIQSRIFTVPWFKHYSSDVIEEYAAAMRKVVMNYEELLSDDHGNPEGSGGWSLSFKS